jgi:hypothetical protein
MSKEYSSIRSFSQSITRASICLAFTFLISLFTAQSASAAAFVVTTTADSGAGSLREKINIANTNFQSDTITFNIPSNSAGCAGLVCIITLTSGELSILRDLGGDWGDGKPVSINAAGMNQVTISGDNTSRVFYLEVAANLTLNGVTITKGNGTGTTDTSVNGLGGGIHSSNGGIMTLTNSTVSGNSATKGGGIYNAFSCTGTLTNSTISGNSAPLGGGIFNDEGGTMTLTNSTVSGNTAYSDNSGRSGGGIFNEGGTMTLTNSTVSGNTTGGWGGGIYNTGFSSSTMTLINSTVSGNSANGSGGGILNTTECEECNATLHLTSVTVTQNQSTITGCPFCNVFAGGVDNLATAYIKNTIIAGNTSANNPSSSDFNGTVGAGSAYNLIGVDAKLAPLANNGGATQTHALSVGSPALDKGSSFGQGTDQRGLVRPVDDLSITNAAGGNGADIGAFEVQTAPVASSSISGTIRYGIIEVNQTQQFVSGVLLSATGTTSTSTSSSGAAGAYTLDGLTAGGNYTVTPTKTGEVKGINSLDATRVQQHRVGLITLTANQLIAADTDGSGTVNSLDATRIQQRAVGIIAQNIIGQWKFVPSSKQYNSLSGNATGEDYQAVLVGEVSGNWASAASFTDDSSTDEDILPKQDNLIDVVTGFENELAAQIAERMKQSANSQSNESKSESAIAGNLQVTVSLLANALAATGSTVTIPVTVGAIPAGSPIESFDFTVFYDPVVLQAVSPFGSNAGTLSANCSVLSNSPQSGRVVVSGACATAITTTSSGVLYNLQFNVIGTSGQQTGLLFNSPSTGTQTFQFNSGTPAANTTNGSFSVLAPTAASVTVAGKVTNYQGRGIRNVLITMTDSAGRDQTTQTTAFGYYKFESVAAGETVTITAKARRYKFSQSSIIRTTNESVSDADFVSEQ